MKKKYFTEANSALGFYDLQEKNLLDIQHIYHLQAPSKQLIDDVLQRLLEHLSQQGYDIESVYSPFDVQLLAGIVIRELSLAFVSGKAIVTKGHVIDLSPLMVESHLEKNKDQLETLLKDIEECYASQTRHFGLAIEIHDEWEKIYIDAIDFKKADAYRRFVLNALFSNVQPLEKEAITRRRFFGASTGDGLLDFVPELTQGLKRYLIKGRPGSGKSTLLKAVVKKGRELGYDTEIHHCSLDPKSLDMVVIPELNLCIFDATAPHEYEPAYETDEIFDTFEAFIDPETDQRFADQLSDIEHRYKIEINSGLTALKKAEALQKEVEAIYMEGIFQEAKENALTTLKEQMSSYPKETVSK